MQAEIVLPVHYLETKHHPGYSADLGVNGCVTVEIKAVERIIPIHFAPLLSYFRLSNTRVGLPINFNVRRSQPAFDGS